ncbi:hypothetical protein SD960_08435 [Flavobacterium sp. MMLR14_040]|uniref:hypothetical protein n=1 Tax=Flavobacterium sp. MMLR14_040 TaxID=3093843 RepID=UPI00298FBE10|nr:hypothetical protein [Flavobacterium sp. MMLR14_040]MDW8850114.1 hypothetical protein [Flavobacterium sp. MMLR14_040]
MAKKKINYVTKESSTGANYIMAFRPEDYDIFEYRINKPIAVKDPNDTSEFDMHFIVQETDEIKINSKHKLEYFIPNNIALLLSISDKALNRGLQIYKIYLNPDKPENDITKYIKDEQVGFLKEKSRHYCDYIEEIETAIVFAYTAVEAFANISIPDNYIYKSAEKDGILYEKKAIERWTSLAEKVSVILPEIYDVKSIKSKSFYNHFKLLEEYRNAIIHQKSVERADFFKLYFKGNINEICKSSESVIRFFYDAHKESNRINPLWPWLIGNEKDFPIIYDDLSNIQRKD